MEKKRRRRKEEKEREPRLPGDKGEEATGHTKQLGTFGTPRCEHRQPQQLNQKEIIFWLNTFILEQKLKIKTTVAFSEDSPPLQRKKNEYLSFGNFPENRSHFWCIVLRSIRQSGGKFKWPFSHF